ncbi:MAG TPA: ATP-binding cassette domain-containing protein [Spirochaetia bacterium]|nr:ATP-binding cassette domain-containing protein [Spirochaetia bacterium]
MSPFVEVHELTKIYRRGGVFQWEGRKFRAIDRVSFSIEEHEVLGLVGESGCGKTTVARSILCLDRPTSGSIRIGNSNPLELRGAKLRGFRRSAQMIFQDVDRALDPRLTVRRSIEEALRSRGVARERRRERIAELLELVGISPDTMEHYPSSFSGGQRQRIVIARALAMEPKFLILDEPVSNLDVSIQAQIVNLLMELRRTLGLTYLFISHDLNLISYISDSIAVMKDGVIVEHGAAEQLIRKPHHPYTRTLFSAIPEHVRGEESSDSPRS